MNHAYLLTGGNLGERAENLQKANRLIAVQSGRIIKTSGVFETAAWGKTSQPDYLNQALLIETSLNASTLLHSLLAIEKQLGRLRQEKYGARIIDIDILFFNDAIVKTPDLVIPHPHLHNRRFVLVPLAEIAAGYLHPVLKKTIETLLSECPDSLNVKKYSLPIEGKQVDL